MDKLSELKSVGVRDEAALRRLSMIRLPMILKLARSTGVHRKESLSEREEIVSKFRSRFAIPSAKRCLRLRIMTLKGGF